MINLDVGRPVKSFFLCCVGILLCMVQPLRAQKDDKVVVLNHADSLVGREINGERVKELFGNVKFSQGRVVVRCQKAVQYLTSNKISLEGEVEVLDSAMRMVGTRGMYYSDDKIAEAFDRVMIEDTGSLLKADYAKYFVGEKKAVFKNHVSVEDTGSTMTADEVTYYREVQHSIAVGNVAITNKRHTIWITGNHFENFRQTRYSKMTEHPKYYQIDTSGGHSDTLTVTGEIMESYQDSTERLLATDSVRLTRAELQAEAGRALFLTKLDSIILRQSPFLWYTTDSGQQNQLSGDSIFLHLVDRKLDRVNVRGRARAISETDSLYPNRYNQMTGQEITLFFQVNKIFRIDVNGTATSLYYLFDGKKPNGVNKTSGDEVKITFRSGRIDKLKVSNGVEGQYYPENLVKKREADYNLLGFNWRGRRSSAQRDHTTTEGSVK